MTLMKPFLIGLTVVLLLLGIAFLVNYLLKNKKIDKTNPKAVRNQKFIFIDLSIYRNHHSRMLYLFNLLRNSQMLFFLL